LKVANGSFRKTKHKNGPIYFWMKRIFRSKRSFRCNGAK
jgi:hypothetical protein